MTVIVKLRAMAAIGLMGLFAACHAMPVAFDPHVPQDPPVSPPSLSPNFIWTADYENGYVPYGDPWGELMVQGGTLEIIDDPTDSGRGSVQRSVIQHDPYPPLEERPEILVYRLYPGVFFPFKPAPCLFSQDVWVSSELVETATHNGNHLVVGPDVFDLTPADGGESRSAVQVVLNKDSLVGGKHYLRIYNREAGGTLGKVLKGAPEISPEKWHRINLFVGDQGDIVLYQDDEPVSFAKYPSTHRLGTVGGHPGLYAGRFIPAGNPLKGWMLVDNFEIRCW
ncbi:MAG: hypothetical protein ACOWWM_12020 [Desulfobacterales bacterium]